MNEELAKKISERIKYVAARRDAIEKELEQLDIIETEQDRQAEKYVQEKYKLYPDVSCYKDKVEQMFVLKGMTVYWNVNINKPNRIYLYFRNVSTAKANERLTFKELKVKLKSKKWVPADVEDWKLPATFKLKGIRLLRKVDDRFHYVGEMSKEKFVIFTRSHLMKDVEGASNVTFTISSNKDGERRLEYRNKAATHTEYSSRTTLIKICNSKEELVEEML